MPKSSKLSLVFSLSLGLLTIGFAVPKPAFASVSCERGTIIKHSNGSLATCILARNTNITVSSRRGKTRFPCKAKEYIQFTDEGQFSSCTLYKKTKVRKGNSFQECLADYPVYLRVDSQGNQDIRCYILRKSS